MAWTKSDLQAVENAIRALISGRPVQSYALSGPDGRNVQYMTLTELRQLRDEMQAEVNVETRGPLRTFEVVPRRKT